jgi:hypothetical protein
VHCKSQTARRRVRVGTTRTKPFRILSSRHCSSATPLTSSSPRSNPNFFNL